METRWIQDFVTLAEVRNFTRAAELRNVSQAAFSRRIQALEHWLGATLVDRSAYPMRITEAGERFRPAAIALLGQISDVRGDMSQGGARNQVRIAMPYALASTRLSQWWRRWCPDPGMGCSVDTGNVHDAMTAFAAGTVDLVIGYHHALHPLVPDAGRSERLLLATETVRPYAAGGAAGTPLQALPGTADRPVPLLMYSPSVYFARVVDTAIDSAPQALHGHRAMEAAMSDVLADLAQAGLGIAWLPDSSFVGGRYPRLVPAGGAQWAVQVDIVAWRARANVRPGVHRIWERMRGD
jgi:DNA-binding transcriptional LysR family regulator